MSLRQYIEQVLSEQGEGEGRRKSRAKPTSFAEPQSPTEFDFADPTSRGAVAPAGPERPAPALPGRGRSRAETQRAMRRARFDPQAADTAADMMAGLRDTLGDIEDEMSDEEAARHAGHHEHGAGATTPGEVEPVRPTVDNLPAVITQAMVRTDYDDNPDLAQEIEPEWTQVSHLPGYMVNQIRALGRDTFRRLMNAEIEDVWSLSTILNPKNHVRGVMQWIGQHGIRDDEASGEMEMEFHRIARRAGAPASYHADVMVYHYGGFSFMLVRDFAGEYVYGGPGRGTELTTDERKSLPTR